MRMRATRIVARCHRTYTEFHFCVENSQESARILLYLSPLFALESSLMAPRTEKFMTSVGYQEESHHP